MERAPGRMSAQQLASARAEMARLKMDPRDTLPNRTALERAEALYVELVNAPRALLRAHIAAFRAALDRQDPNEMDEARASLVLATTRLRGELS